MTENLTVEDQTDSPKKKESSKKTGEQRSVVKCEESPRKAGADPAPKEIRTSQDPPGDVTAKTPIKEETEPKIVDESVILVMVKEEQHKECETEEEEAASKLREIVEDSMLLTVNKTEDAAGTVECKEEVPTSPQLFSPPRSIERRSKTRKTSQESLRDTPLSKKSRRCDNGSVTPSKQRKRKVSHVSDYDQLSDTTKAELLDPSHLNDFEAIDLLHDLDTVMDFEDTKISSDVLLSSMSFNHVTQEDLKESSDDDCDDPPMDPLFIGNSEVKTEPNVDNAPAWSDSAECKPDQEKARRRSDKYNMRTLQEKKPVDSSKENKPIDGCALSENKIQRLSKLEVKLLHAVPPQHKIEQGAGSIPPTQMQKKIFMRFGPLRKGTFSPMEDRIIRDNWRNFCKVHHWDPKEVEPFLYLRHGTKYYITKFHERQKFVQFLANGLPWRTLYSVHHRFRKLYQRHDHTHTRYTPAEDEEILAHAAKYKRRKGPNQMYSELAKVLGRSRSSVWLRHQTLKRIQQDEKKPITKVEWTLPLIQTMIRHLLQTTLSENISELKDAALPKPVWQKVEEKMNIDNAVLKTFWVHQLHMQLFCPRPIYLNDIKIQLIEYIHEKGVSNTREIIWPNVAKYFEGITTVFLCKVFCDLVREVSTKTSLTKFPSILEYLYREKIPEIRRDQTDKYLPRLAYNNGRMEIIDDDTSNHTDAE